MNTTIEEKLDTIANKVDKNSDDLKSLAVEMRDGFKNVMRYTDEKIEELAVIVKKNFDLMEERFDQVDDRFSQIDNRFAQMDNRFDRIEMYTSGQERRIEIIEDKIRLISTKIGLRHA